MDLNSLKEKALKLKERASKTIDDSIIYSAKKLTESSITISNKNSLDSIIKKSKTSFFTDEKTGEKKTYKHKSIIIFWENNSFFFKKALINFPILVTKAFSQNISLKLAINKIKDVDLKEYWINSFPCLVVFENEKVYKIINGEKNIQKLVNSINLDINSEIEKI